MSCTSIQHHKKTDIFAPSKAIQDAKDKLGPMYFDISLLACSKNAVELTKLVNEWENLEKKKAKKMKEVSKDQNHLLSRLKEHKAHTKELMVTSAKEVTSHADVTKDYESSCPPGFRFHCNGESKSSTSHLPVIIPSGTAVSSHIDVASTGRSSVVSMSKRRSSKTDTYTHVDYNKEIHELEEIIHEIYSDLSKSKINLYNISGGHYLRAHQNEYTPPTELVELADSDRRHSRITLKSATSSAGHNELDLHTTKQKVTARHTCSACEEKRQADQDRMSELKKRREAEKAKKEQKNAQSCTQLKSTKSTLYHHRAAKACSAGNSNYKHIEVNKKCTIRFADDEKRSGMNVDLPNRRSKSETTRKYLTADKKSETTIWGKSTVASSVQLHGLKSDSLSVESFTRSQGSRVSLLSGIPSSTYNYRIRHKRPSVAELKAKQVEEMKNSNEKVKEFLKSLNTVK